MFAPLDDIPAAVAGSSDPAIGWAAFRDIDFIAEMALVLAVSVLLAALIAYHPTTRGKASTIEEIEQPKTFIMYSMIGAVIAIIVKVQPNMALVVFGIGGLMRFRTNVGLAKDTGRVILVTVVGLSCGLGLYVVAVLSTVFGWVMIYVLESRSVERVVVQGLEKSSVQPAALAYTRALTELGCTIIGEQKNVKKGTVAIIYRAPRGLGRPTVEAGFGEIPEGERGTADWDST